MTGFDVFNAIGTIASIVGAINALKDSNNSTAADLFKESCTEAVRQSAPNFADLTTPEEVDVDGDTLITLLKDIDISTLLTSPEEDAALIKIATLFKKCIILPRHQLIPVDLEQRLQPVIKKTFAIFLERLPRNQQATNEMMLEFAQSQLASQDRLIKDTETIKKDTNQIEEINKTTQTTYDTVLDLDARVTDLSNRHLDISPSAAVETVLEKEHQSVINYAKDLLRKNKPQSAIDSLENLKRRIWTDASLTVKFSILTNMAVALFALNREQEAAMLVIEAFQYNHEDEKALSNCASAYFLLEEKKEAEKYAKKTLRKNQVNAQARAILVAISADDEKLEDVIAEVPEYLREKPQIAYAISNIAKHRGNLEEARKWRETVVASDYENDLDFKTGLAAILIEQVLENPLTVYTKQLNDSQKNQLRQAVELLTEAWDSVADTELRTARIDWIINRSTAHYLLGNLKEVIEDLDTALEIGQPDPILIKNRAILALEQGEKENAIEFVEKILSVPETPEASTLLANILFVCERHNEATTTLNDFLMTNPSTELQEDANRLLIQIYIADERFEEAQQISNIMMGSSPTSVLNLVNAARISSATEESEKALSQLKEAYNLAQSSDVFQEIFELADELGKHEQFKEAAVLYEKLADTNYNSEWTQRLLYSYYRSGEAAKALEICQGLREKYGPLENTSKIEYEIYKEIGDLNQAQILGEAYLSGLLGKIICHIFSICDILFYLLNQMERSLQMGKRIHHLREVSEIEAKALRKLSKSRTQPYRRVQRAKLLVHMIDDETLTASKAAKQAGFKSGVSGAHWVNRFNEAGLEGLTDKPRSGKPDTHSQQVRSRVIDLALRKPRELGYPFELWTLKRLQSAFKEREGIHLSDSTIWEWLRNEGLRWKRQQSWFADAEKHDEAFVEKRGPL